MTTPKEIAKWMLNKLEKQRMLYQEDTVFEIERIFGDEYIYENENGNPAIDRRVLRAFRELIEKTVVWERGEKCWLHREPFDDHDTRQAD